MIVSSVNRGEKYANLHKMLCHIGAMMFAVSLVVVPWCIKNSLIVGEPMFLSANTGMNLYQGNNPISDGGWPQFERYKDLYREFIPKGRSWLENDK